MADKFYGVAIGGKLATDVTKANSTNSTAVELRVTVGATTNRQDILNAIEAIETYVIQDNFPAG